MSNPFAILGLSEDATVEQVKVAWRGLARVHHPDAGGKVEDFERYRAAFTEAVGEAERRPCPECHGTGKVPHTVGFSTIHVPCSRCS